MNQTNSSFRSDDKAKQFNFYPKPEELTDQSTNSNNFNSAANLGGRNGSSESTNSGSAQKIKVKNLGPQSMLDKKHVKPPYSAKKKVSLIKFNLKKNHPNTSLRKTDYGLGE